MSADRRPLPLVTADGPMCNPRCQLLVRKYDYDLGETVAYLCELGTHGSECLPALREAWLRERERAKRTCGRCGRFRTKDGVTGTCPNRQDYVDFSESCSRFEERKDG